MPAPIAKQEPTSVFVIGSLILACCARVARCPEPGESLGATDFIMEVGGKGFNVALASRRLGVPVDGVFALGDDASGALMRRTFTDLGFDENLLCTVEGGSGAGVGLIQADGENRIAVFPGANANLSPRHVLAGEARLRTSGIVFAQFEVPDAPIAAAFAVGRDAGVTTMLNPSPYRSISDEILSLTDVVVVNEREAAALASDRHWTGSYDLLAANLVGAGVSALIVTRGKYGAIAWRGGERFEQPAFPIEVVDSIGAGDAFAGGIIAALAEGQDLRIALRWGCAAGALVCSQFGIVAALPGFEKLVEMMSIKEGR